MPPHTPKPSRVVRDVKKMDDLYGITDDERVEALEWIATLKIPTAFQKALAKGVDLEKIVEGWCHRCGEKATVRYPDYGGAAKFFDLMFKYKLEKPSELRELNVNVTHRNVIEMNPEEREVYKRQLLSQMPRKALPPGPSAA